MSRLRLDLLVRRYSKPGLDMGGKGQDRWSWRLWSGSRVVATSGPQLYSRRIACARGAEVGAGLMGVADCLKDVGGSLALRYRPVGHLDSVPVRILDEREATP